MARRLTGKEVAADLGQRTAETVEHLKERGTVPCLGVIRVGEKEADLSYERGLTKRCESAGIRVDRFVLPEDVSEEGLLDVVREVNGNPAVHGILIFRPLPKSIDERKVLEAISPEKDVDCVTDASLAGVFTGRGGGFAPCTAEAVMRILEYYGIDCRGKRAVVVGRSIVIGKPVAMLLLQKNATVTIAHTKTVDLPGTLREADIIVAAAGHAGTVTAACVRAGQVIVDVGINVSPEGKLVGDVDYAGAEPVVAAITPVPGGVGAVTTAVLVSHVAEAALQQVQRAEAKK